MTGLSSKLSPEQRARLVALLAKALAAAWRRQQQSGQSDKGAA